MKNYLPFFLGFVLFLVIFQVALAVASPYLDGITAGIIFTVGGLIVAGLLSYFTWRVLKKREQRQIENDEMIG